MMMGQKQFGGRSWNWKEMEVRNQNAVLHPGNLFIGELFREQRCVAAFCDRLREGGFGSLERVLLLPLPQCFFLACRSLRTSSAQCPCGIALPFLWNLAFDQPKRQAVNQQEESLSLYIYIYIHLDLGGRHKMKRHVCSKRFLSERIN